MNTIPVLLVDDNVIFLRILQDFLEENWGTMLKVVGTARSGEEALTLAQATQPQVIFLDLAMPGQGGLKTIAQIKRDLPAARIIVVTLSEGAYYRQAARDAGADGYVAKENLDTGLGKVLAKILRDGKLVENSGFVIE